MKRALEILENVNSINIKEQVSLDTPNGVLNKEYVELEKNLLIAKYSEYLANNLVKAKQHYPEDEVSKVDLEFDIIFLNRREYKELKKLIEKNIINNE